ncbi:hypothetical protein ACFVWT_06375 [Arthrobacter sp. NPDC058288]|uniref:hypothetical protein n=1 Tax=Arthrobacter sp. NPDC058288 TaxID=3346424 RepID=UPI0036EA7735
MTMPLRALTALALFIDAGVHIHLAPGYQGASPAGIGQGNLFLIESAAAVMAGLYVLIRGSRASFAIALMAALSAFAAVVLYRYVDIPAFGPFPAMYDPVWFFEKSLSAVAEGAGTLLAAAGLVLTAPGRRTTHRRASAARPGS